MSDRAKRILLDVLYFLFVIVPLFLYVLNHEWKVCAFIAIASLAGLMIVDIVRAIQKKKSE